jgi:hypothetical protein
MRVICAEGPVDAPLPLKKEIKATIEAPTDRPRSAQPQSQKEIHSNIPISQ